MINLSFHESPFLIKFLLSSFDVFNSLTLRCKFWWHINRCVRHLFSHFFVFLFLTGSEFLQFISKMSCSLNTIPMQQKNCWIVEKEFNLLQNVVSQCRPLVSTLNQKLIKFFAQLKFLLWPEQIFTLSHRRPARSSFLMYSSMNAENALGLTFFFPILEWWNKWFESDLRTVALATSNDSKYLEWQLLAACSFVINWFCRLSDYPLFLLDYFCRLNIETILNECDFGANIQIQENDFAKL